MGNVKHFCAHLIGDLRKKCTNPAERASNPVCGGKRSDLEGLSAYLEPGHCVVGASGSAGFVLPLVPVLLGALLVPVALVGVGLFH